MSAVPPGALFGELALFRPLRSIGGFVAQVTVLEDHRDQLTITQHPVETGAAITDHAFKMPATVLVEVGWADDPRVLANIYSQLIAMQWGRQPFTVYTGKRIYSNMLVAQMRTQTDAKTASTLVVQLVLQEIIMVSTQRYQTATAPQNPATTPQSHAEPQNTAKQLDQGKQNLKPAPVFNPAPSLPPAIDV